MLMTSTLTGSQLRDRTTALRLVKVCIAALLAASFHGCSSSAPPQGVSDTLRIGVGASSGSEVQAVLTEMLYAEPLLYTDWHGRAVERLAASWRWENDGLTLSVELRPNIRLHDGRPLTAEFVANVIRRESRVRGFEYLRSIEAPGPLSLVLTLRRPDAFLVDELAGTLIVDGDVGTGPFTLKSRAPTIEADRNDAYYRGRPGLAHVQIVSYDRQRAAWVAMMRGDLDMLQEVARESVDFLEGASKIKTYSSIRPFYIPLVFNLRHPILGRVEVRRALAEAIDREEIVAQAMRGHGMVADDPIWPYNWAYSAAARRRAFNPNAAAMRLDVSGLPMRAPTADRMASRFRLTCLFWREGPQFERIALLLQRQLSAVGVDLDLEPLSMRDLQARVKVGNFDTYLMYMTSGRTFQRTYRFWHSPPHMGAEFQSLGYAGADAVLDRLRVARAESEIRAGVADLRQRFYEDVPAAFLAWPETTRAVDVRFDVATQQSSDIFADLWMWRPAAAPAQRAAR